MSTPNKSAPRSASWSSPRFDLDLRQSIKPLLDPGAGRWHSQMKPPQANLDSRLGLQFPLNQGGLSWESRKRISDRAGSLEIRFQLAERPADGQLLGAFGQYQPLLSLGGDRLKIHIYHWTTMLVVDWQMQTSYRLRMSWDHRAGITVHLSPSKGDDQRLHRRMTWQAFNQPIIPLTLGGSVLSKARLGAWTGSFKGWISQLKLWDQPQDSPPDAMPPRVVETGPEVSPLPAHAGVRLLQIHDPAVVESRHRCRSIPDRLVDLRKTRRVAGLDELVKNSRDQMHLFAAVTYKVSRMWPHFHYWPWRDGMQRDMFWQRGHRMVRDIQAGEMAGMCGGFSHLMEELFWSLGVDARRVQVIDHSSFQAFSDQHNKWVILDASQNRNAHYFVDGQGVPLGVLDLIHRHRRRAWEENPFADVRAAVLQDDLSVKLVDASAWVELYSFAGVGTGDPGVKQGQQPHLLWLPDHQRPAASLFYRAMGSNAQSMTTLVDQPEDMFWSCNRVKVKLAWHQPGQILRVDARPVGVTFADGLEVRFDDQAWQRTAAQFKWILHPGVNEMSVRTRNLLSNRGHPWRMQLWARA